MVSNAFVSSTTKYVQLMPLTYFMVSNAFVWEKVKTMDFSETIVLFDITVLVGSVK